MAECDFPGGGFGAGGFGTTPFGSGLSPTWTVGAMFAAGINDIAVCIVGAPANTSNVCKVFELDPSLWTLELVDPQPCFLRLVQAVTYVANDPYCGGQAFHVFTDGALSPGCDYRLTYRGNCNTGVVTGLLAHPLSVPRSAQGLRPGEIADINNPQVEQDRLPLGSLGTFGIANNGDLANDLGLASLRKRILRRITSAVGSFYHLPNYGTDTESKRLITPDLLDRIKSRVDSGVRREPDLLRASSRVSRSSEANLVTIEVFATAKFGQELRVSDVVDFGA